MGDEYEEESKGKGFILAMLTILLRLQIPCLYHSQGANTKNNPDGFDCSHPSLNEVEVGKGVPERIA